MITEQGLHDICNKFIEALDSIISQNLRPWLKTLLKYYSVKT